MSVPVLNILFYPQIHNNLNRIFIKFNHQQDIINIVKDTYGRRWSKTKKSWHLPDEKEIISNIYFQLKELKIPNYQLTIDTKLLLNHFNKKEIPEIKVKNKKSIQVIKTNIIPLKNNIEVFKKYSQQLILKGYSKSTIKTYSNEFRQFLCKLTKKSADTLTHDDLRKYFEYCFTKLKLSENSIHSRLNAVKFYYEQTLDNPKFYWEIPRPKKPLQLPKVLNESELKRLFDAAIYLKHKALLFVAYSAGLRVSEVINLRLQDIDRERGQMFIHCSKNKKDRYVRLSPIVLDILEQYYKMIKTKPVNYIFEGLEIGKPYSARSAQQVFANCKAKAGIIKTLSFHSMRHSFATHTLEKGVDVIFIKEMLGHFNIKTTERYLHVRKDFLINIESPIEDLYKKK